MLIEIYLDRNDHCRFGIIVLETIVSKNEKRMTPVQNMGHKRALDVRPILFSQ